MRLRPLLPLIGVLLAISSRPAFADATLFLGKASVGSAAIATKPTIKGFAIGAGLLIVGVEFEYASNPEDAANYVPALRTGTGNVYVQTPIAIAGLRFYATTGGGFYRETGAGARIAETQKTGFASNVGGGVKISLVGPLKVRVDYRVFKLHGERSQLLPWRSTVQRIYAGINLGF
jgi:hypothetical protein